jgi:hypothetical protein
MKKRMKVIFLGNHGKIIISLFWTAFPSGERGELLTTNPNYWRSRGITMKDPR